jgi:ketosteroid isomerase-like protein
MSRSLAALLALVAFAGCARKIPDTDIEDSTDSRAIVSVIDQYRKALDRRDAAAILALVSRSYFDDAGTSDPSDDLDFAQLSKALPASLKGLSDVKLELAVSKIEVKGDSATADLLYDSRYRVATPRGEVAKRDSDVHRMKLHREDGAWKISSGL